ncbi:MULTISPECIES: TetR family transcriptional regulator [Pseudomonas]|uniref:TetR family transcriptional regulator n=1 Tax=Pseudomonas TaxID=286 RepID=UPI0003794810|nr:MULTISPECIES: TetR family transcriptional regulator [Pseudomonas]MDC7830779.1 TetR family transcriptional regulator [Pseudomonas benzopyrenica]NRH43441.1 TetR family transcriptional regulator [Pseudomonas sp. MS15a(2019)]
MRRTKEDAENIRQTILDAAEALFFTNGVSRTSLEMIARDCGVTRGAVYWHFKDKAQLLRELFDRIRIPLDKVNQQLLADGEGDCLMRLYELCVECMEKFVQPGRERRVMTILVHRYELTQDIHEFEQRENALTREFVALLERLFDGQQQRLQVGITPRSASLQLHSFFFGTLASILRDREVFEPLLDVRLTFNLYFRSLVKDWS